MMIGVAVGGHWITHLTQCIHAQQVAPFNTALLEDGTPDAGSTGWRADSFGRIAKSYIREARNP